ncbi:MAG: 1-deoxy-11-beta-hydroxypentalenate dehydrogenase [Deltaproteobacteria bacterium ADurb.Bin135]|nr:MAG: 1-deoxy-11-beta-hydroxypentalenate dehydrogenase [Deltaproteobacteria bacterium ADurb.Bin135]
MKEFKGKTAVVTGAASGIGRALAARCVREGMKVVLADVEEGALLQTEKEMKDTGAVVLAVRTDVSKAEDVEKLAQKTLETFQEIHLLFNNAGVQGGEFASIWKNTIADWEWALGVNLWGVIHGIRIFVPIMLRQGTECHIVNTSSLSGIIAGPGLGVYRVTKHGVFSLSETLFHELSRKGSQIGVSVLAPYFVSTRVADSDRNRPSDAGVIRRKKELSQKESHAWMRKAIQEGMSPDEVAEIVFGAIREKRFYVFTDPDASLPFVRMRFEDILAMKNPRSPLDV